MKRVLVVDDSFELREMLRLLLVSYGYVVVGAGDAREAIGLLQDRTFDVVITDLLMPGGDGIELILFLRNQRLPVRLIVMSGGGVLSASTYLSIAKGFHPDALLHKPFSCDAFLAAVGGETSRGAALPAASCLA